MRLCANILGRNIYVRFKFSSMRSSHDLCAHAHSLGGTLLMTSSVKFSLSVLVPQNVSNGHKANNNSAMNFSTLLFSSIDSIASPGNSFIHTEHLYSASSRELLRGAPDSSTAKKSSAKKSKWCERGTIWIFLSSPALDFVSKLVCLREF